MAERELLDRSYAHMTYDESPTELGRIYGSMTPADRIKYAEERPVLIPRFETICSESNYLRLFTAGRECVSRCVP
jgi:hypothetical protein